MADFKDTEFGIERGETRAPRGGLLCKYPIESGADNSIKQARLEPNPTPPGSIGKRDASTERKQFFISRADNDGHLINKSKPRCS